MYLSCTTSAISTAFHTFMSESVILIIDVYFRVSLKSVSCLYSYLTVGKWGGGLLHLIFSVRHAYPTPCVLTEIAFLLVAARSVP